MTAADLSYSRRWLNLAVVGVAQVMVVLDTTVVNIALPATQRAQLAPDLQEIQGNISFYLWIGPGNQIKRLTEIEHLPAATIKVSYTINWIDRPLHLTIPPSSQVIVLPTSTLDSAPGGVIG